METEKWVKGGWVRIIRNGNNGSHPYKIGEYWQISQNPYSKHWLYIKRGKVECDLYTTESPNAECEWIGMDIPNKQPAYWW